MSVMRLIVSRLTGSRLLKLYCPQMPHIDLRVTRYEVRVASYGLVTGCELQLRVAGYELRFARFGVRVPLFVDVLDKLVDLSAKIIVCFNQSSGTLFGHFMGISNKA